MKGILLIVDEILRACGPLFFKSDSSEIKAEGEECLREISLQLRLADNYFLVVDVHRASTENDELSTARIKKVRDYFIKQKEIDRTRLIVRDYSESCPHETDEANFNARLEFWCWREKKKVDLIPKRCGSGAKPRYRIID